MAMGEVLLRISCPISDCPNKSVKDLKGNFLHTCKSPAGPGAFGETKINASLELVCARCNERKDIRDELFDCATKIPGNPHGKAKERGEGRGLFADWRGIRDGVLAAVNELESDGRGNTRPVMKVSQEWLKKFEQNIAKRRYESPHHT